MLAVFASILFGSKSYHMPVFISSLLNNTYVLCRSISHTSLCLGFDCVPLACESFCPHTDFTCHGLVLELFVNVLYFQHPCQDDVCCVLSSLMTIFSSVLWLQMWDAMTSSIPSKNSACSCLSVGSARGAVIMSLSLVIAWRV